MKHSILDDADLPGLITDKDATTVVWCVRDAGRRVQLLEHQRLHIQCRKRGWQSQWQQRERREESDEVHGEQVEAALIASESGGTSKQNSGHFRPL
jgi:hypothetical protein